MNPSKSILFKISMAGIITSMCILVFSCFTPKPKVVDDDILILGNGQPDLDGSSQDGGSQAISWNAALAMTDYWKQITPIKTINVKNDTVPLEGFKIKTSSLLNIINHNKQGNGEATDYVMIYFGASKPQTAGGLPTYNIIAVGGSNNNDRLMIPTTPPERDNANLSSIYDKADPCPPRCPTKD